MRGRREQVLDAAMHLLGTEGARRLTYQAVDAAAGVPPGTTSNHFRTRAALVAGLAEHLEKLDRRTWEALTDRIRPTDPAGLADALAGLVVDATGPGRDRTAARYALFLEAAARPELRAPLARGRSRLTELGVSWLARLGSTDPERHCAMLLEYLDGTILGRLTFPGTAPDPAPRIRALLNGLLGSGPAASHHHGQ
ncbi:TetR family transcriptional regulator [Prauserella shujinwangii]|uniref:TetR family transcriptional regulator n=1 Tax=Prauserella shujinwangii TaxID=1453103 RepID=A0A2T0LR12_9PSEU|nr:TetR/AcrR family transcriptional regulator [Prauserella shujinwangii]PRX45927.1 TetR family transcriptional regulator [Prauserella shujinwangii]